jgi:hypothetical protein
MKKIFRAFIAALFICVFTFAANDIKVSTKDFSIAFGFWKGSLTYLDYSSGKPYTMPAEINISADSTNKNGLIFIYQYPNEPKANGNDTLQINESGTMINGALVVLKQKDENGALKIITEKAGIDGNDNRKATIRHTFFISEKIFSNTKDVKFEGEKNWIRRNEYSFRR